MGIAVFPPASGGGIKSVQRGSAGGAGNVTISAVDINKAFVNVYGTESSGTVAATGTVNAANGTASSFSGTLASGTLTGNSWGAVSVGTTQRGVFINGYYGQISFPGMTANARNFNANSQNISLNAANISGGSNNLVAAVVQGYLSDSVTLVVSGACRWEVVEFN